MRHWLLLGCLAFSLPAKAQNDPITQKIAYRRDLPQSVKRSMPKGAKSLFWGKFSPTKGATPMALHMFARYPKEVSKNADPNGEDIYHFMLDVFESKGKSWRRINRVSLTHKAFLWGPVIISMRLSWLHKTTKKEPVLIFDEFTNEALLPGPYGDGVFVTFKDGWKGKVNLNVFGNGTSNYSSLSYQEEYDENGLLQVATSETTNDATNEKRIYKWNGREFFFKPGTEKLSNPTRDFSQGAESEPQ